MTSSLKCKRRSTERNNTLVYLYRPSACLRQDITCSSAFVNSDSIWQSLVCCWTHHQYQSATSWKITYLDKYSTKLNFLTQQAWSKTLQLVNTTGCQKWTYSAFQLAENVKANVCLISARSFGIQLVLTHLQLTKLNATVEWTGSLIIGAQYLCN